MTALWPSLWDSPAHTRGKTCTSSFGKFIGGGIPRGAGLGVGVADCCASMWPKQEEAMGWSGSVVGEEEAVERPQRSLQHIRFVGSKVKRWTGDPLRCQPLQHFVGCFVKFFSPWQKFFFPSPVFLYFSRLVRNFPVFFYTCFPIFSRCCLNNEIFDCWLFAVQCYSSSSMRVKVDRAAQNKKGKD